MKKINEEIKFCPKCRSTNIMSDIADAWVSDYCGDCGFNSRMTGMNNNLQFPTKSKINQTK